MKNAKPMAINCTIFYYVADGDDVVTLHVPMPTTQEEVWMHVLAKEVGVPDLQLSEVERIKDEIGDDLLDYHIIAVIAGIHNCVYETLPS